MRFFIKFSYKGTNYHGWQKQPNAISVQEVLEKGLSTILNQNVVLMGAGRTDTGVHAKEMYAHFDFPVAETSAFPMAETIGFPVAETIGFPVAETSAFLVAEPVEATHFNIENTIHKLNSFLPIDIVVFEIFKANDHAHARFDAKKRTYQYHINPFKNAFLTNQSWYYHQNLNIDLMNKAAQILLQYTDFQCFSKAHTDVNTFNCTVFESFWIKENNQLIFTITADRFLRNMVRAIVGTLVYVGINKITIEEFEQIIKNKNRSEAGFSVPACGLFLTKIEYDYLQ
jgi:tRNA pseudouridine38-40 synthase